MRRLALILASLLVLVSGLFAQAAPPAKIRIGDALSVYVFGAQDMTGAFTVQSDGAIYVPRAGRLVVSGLNVQQAQTRLLALLRRIFVAPTATISIAKQRTFAIFVVGGDQGVLELSPETDLRQVYAAAKVPGDPDLLQLSVFRSGIKIATMDVSDLTSGRKKVFNGPLQPNDVVVFEPRPFIRVWVIGTVRVPGRLRLNEGDDVYRAIAQAGDLPAQTAGTGANQLRSEYQVTIRRGPDVIEVPLVADPSKPPVKLEDGDTVSVQPPAQIRVVLTGETTRPGENVFKAGTPLVTAVSAAGGASPQGSLRGVILFHNGAATIHDLTPSPTGQNMTAGPVLQDGDVVYVPENKKTFSVFGSVNRVGRYTMQDTREYHLSDAVAEAGGTTANGTLTRVSLGRAGADGKLLVTTYRLDKFVKSGHPEDNPVVQPNDVVYVDSSRGISFASVTSALSAALLVQSLTRL